MGVVQTTCWRRYRRWRENGNTHHTSVVDEIVDALVSNKLGDKCGCGAHRSRVCDIYRNDAQLPADTIRECVEGGGFGWIATTCYDNVRGVLQELFD